jgi:CMP-N-acetylneuraminic acid synthetase
MKKYKDKRLCFVERSRESTFCSRSIAFTLDHVVRRLNLSWEGIMALTYIQAPFTATETIEEAVYTLILNRADSSFAVEEIQDNLYRRTPYGLTPITPQNNHRSDFDMIYSDVQTSLASHNHNFKSGSLTGARISYFVIPKAEAFYINSKQDFEIAKILLRKK